MNSPRIPAKHDLVLLSERLPVDPVRPDGESIRWCDRIDCPLSDLRTIVTVRRGAWVGRWGQPGSTPEPFELDRVPLHPLRLTRAESDEFDRYCGDALTPLFHDRIEPPLFGRGWGDAYRAVNLRYAETAAEVAAPGGVAWIHDLYLQLVPGQLRRVRPDLMIGFLLHGPFPPAELFMQLPNRAEMLLGMLGADLIGFQQPYEARSFLDLADRLLGLPVDEGVVTVNDRHVQVATFPSAVDVEDVEKRAAQIETQRRADEFRGSLNNPKNVLLAVGRLEPSSGVMQRLDAYAALLGEGRLDPTNTALIEVVAPSSDVGAVWHGRLRAQIERRIGQINGEYATIGRPVIHYIDREVGRAERVALYLAADVFLDTPLSSAPALAAQEFLIARAQTPCRVVLGERVTLAGCLPAGSAVNPYDIDATTMAMLAAVAGVQTSSDHVRDLRASVRDYGIDRATGSFLQSLGNCVTDDVARDIGAATNC